MAAGGTTPGPEERATLRSVSEPAAAVPSPEVLLTRAREVIAAAAREGLPMRLLGGLAVYALAGSARQATLVRPYRDFDVAVPAKRGAAASRVLEAAHVAQRIGVLRDTMERTPKSLRWKVRARVGERLTWYEMPEELD